MRGGGAGQFKHQEHVRRADFINNNTCEGVRLIYFTIENVMSCEERTEHKCVRTRKVNFKISSFLCVVMEVDFNFKNTKKSGYKDYLL